MLGTADDGIQLLVCSPAVDAGTSTNAPATDILGNARFNGDGQGGAEPDMGAYESQILQNPPAGVISGTTEICPGSSTPLAVTITNGTAPFKVVYSNGTDQFTLDNYTSGTSISVSPAATTTYTLVSITDANKCEATSLTGSAIVTVLTPPSFSTTPSNRSSNTAAGLCTAVVNYTATAAGSNTTLHPLSLSYTLTGATTGTGSGTGSGLVFNKGITTVTITATNGCTPDAIHTFTINVTDNEKPVVTAGSNLTGVTSTGGEGDCSLEIAVPSVTFSDNCPESSVAWTLTGATTGSGSGQVGSQTFAKGLTTITYTATDASFNTGTASITVTVTDDEAPTITAAPNITTVTSADGTGNCTAAIAVPNATFADNCTGSELSWTMSGATSGNGPGQVGTKTFNKGTTTISYTVTDGASLTATASLTVTLTDDEAPTLTAAANQNAGISASCEITIPDLAALSSTSDNCTGTMITQSPLAGVNVPASRNQTIEVTITATDAAGLTDEHTVTLTAKDVTAPSAPSLPIIHGICSASVPSPSAPDNCGGPVPGITSDPTSYTSQGTFTVNWTFTDISGNSSSTTQTVIVSDTQAPTITAPANIVTNNNSGCDATGVSLGTATTSDNCGVVSVTNDGPPSYPIGVTTVTWTVTDVNGNSATATQTVTVLATTLAIAGDAVSHLLSGGADDIYATDCRLVARIDPSTGTNGVSGDLDAKVYIDETVPASHPYVARHYDLSPSFGAESATATVTLYFTQQEFTEYNTRAGSELLPAGPTGNKSNLYINQFHGTSETGAIGSYSGASVTPFHPSNDNIVWNGDYSRWEVTFYVNGFSGFFVTGNSSPLPVTLTSMTARAVENSFIEVRWETSQEVNFDHFQLERTEDPKKGFAYLATIQPDKKGALSKYVYADQTALSGVTQYYRLKMLDLDGTFAYSKVVTAKWGSADLEINVYPSPATDILTIRSSDSISGYKLINNLGITILDQEIRNETNVGQLDLTKYQSGIYQLLIRLKDGREMYKKVLLIR